MKPHPLLLTVVLLGWSLASSALADPSTRPTNRIIGAELGVNIHFTKAQPGEVKMMADAGVSIVRMDFAWAGIERKAGEYDFAAYDGLLAAVDEYQIRAIFILDYGNKLYDDGVSPHTDVGRAAFAKWAAAAVAHFKGRRVIWEMWNEPNGGFWKPKVNVGDYVKLALETGKAIRAIDPTAEYIGPATSEIDLPFLESCFKAGCLEYWSAVTVHPYRQTEPETVVDGYRQLRALIRQYAPKDKKIPIYSGEWGYSAAWKNFDETKQAKYLPRQWLTNIANDVPISIWYDWHDDGKDPKEPEHHFGTTRNERKKEGAEPWTPKPVYLAMKTLSEQLGGFEFSGWLDEARHSAESNGTRVMLFARKDATGKPVEARAAVWTTSKKPDRVKISCFAAQVKIRGMLGANGPTLTPNAGNVELDATDEIQYLIPEKSDELWLVAASWQRAPLERTARGGGWPPEAFTEFRNPLARPLSIAWSVPEKAEPASVTLPPDGRAQIPNRGALLSRNEELQYEVSRLKVESFGELEQFTEVRVTNPIRLDLVGIFGEAKVVRIEDVSAEGFKGKIEVSTIRKSASAPVDIAPGQRTATVHVTRADEAIDSGKLGLKAETLDGRGISDVWFYAYRPVADFGEVDLKIKAVAEGDRNVKSMQVVRKADPAAGALGTGISSLELAYRFDAGHKFIQLMPVGGATKLQGTPKELRLWLFGDNSNNLVRCRFVDASGQVFQPTFGKMSWTGWKLVTFPLDGKNAGHWGGKDDGVVQYPLKLDTLLLIDNATRQRTEGKLYITAPMTVE